MASKQKIISRVFATLAITGLMSAGASASSINFDQVGGEVPGGTISYAGGNAPLIGSDIGFGIIRLVGGDALICEDCVLNFTTGNFASDAGPNLLTFNGGGSLSISGTAENVPGNTIASGPIVFNSAFDEPLVVSRSGANALFVGAGVNEVNDDVLNFFGIALNTDFIFVNLTGSLDDVTTVDGGPGTEGNFSGAVTDADFTTTTVVAVAEPAVVGMFTLGLMLLGFGVFVRRKS